MKASAQTTSDLGKLFVVHLSALNGDIETVQAKLLWQDIADRYNESQRAYHTLEHLAQLFAQFEQVQQYLHEPHIIALALYYHDVIYEPRHADNELQSAEYMIKKLSPYLDVEQCRRIDDLIMLTADHELDEDKDSDLDAAFLLDMDLSILGSVWSDYKRYAQAVRQEYSHVPITNYRTGRTKVLAGLLAHPRLYLTDYYFERLEAQARDNIKREISLLLC
ncbi:HD domain-containing protein [Psychrobacter fulvigenes]|uniref:HD domain-containing protein n=1 Tax=Psychrobacter fulvigenes TaxID=533323 RepID=UPI0019196944|nr:hypothetical protein [Psychrobacter fulvigenes]